MSYVAFDILADLCDLHGIDTMSIGSYAESTALQHAPDYPSSPLDARLQLLANLPADALADHLCALPEDLQEA